MDYGDLFTRAWRIVWDRKFMLVLGFLAVFGGSSTTNFTFSFGPEDIPFGIENRIELFVNQFLPIILVLICLGLIVAILFWLLRLTAQAGLIESAARLDAGDEATFGRAMSWGVSKLGRMVGINLLLYGPFIIIASIFVGVGIAVMVAAVGSNINGTESGMWQAIAGSIAIIIVCFGLIACILVPLWLALTVIYPFAQRGAVLQDLGVVESIRHGWGIVKQNIGDVILLVLFFVAISIGFGLVIGLLTVPLAFLAFSPIVMDVIATGTFDPGNLLLMFCGSIVVSIIIALLNAVIIAFRSATITLAYQQFAAKVT